MSVSSNAANQSNALRSLRELAVDSSRELEMLRSELKEINMLITQTNSEIERLENHAAEMATRLNDAEMAPDNYTRAEMRTLYANTHEIEMRLFMMKGQIEQLEYKQERIKENQQRLQRVVDVAEVLLDEDGSGSMLPAEDGGGQSAFVGRTTRPGGLEQDFGKIIDAQEVERQRIARRIHDGPAQALANLILRAEICERLLSADLPAAKSELADLKGRIAITLGETRQFIFDLRPMILDDLGLVPTLRRYAESMAARTGVSPKVSVDGLEGRLPVQIEIGLFRITQEALENSIDHGKASAVQVSLESGDGIIRLTVEDNGTGFNVDEALTATSSSGLHGLSGMRERAHTLGGKFSVESTPGHGAKVRVEIPL